MIVSARDGYPQLRCRDQRGIRDFGQHSYVLHPDELMTRSQAVGKYGERGLISRLAMGTCLRLFRGVYIDSAIEIDDRVRISAALLSAGQHLIATRESAARLHGFGVLDTPLVHLAGPSTETARSQDGLRLHGIRFRPEELTAVHGISVTTADRTVVDLARALTGLDALAVVDAALRTRACTAETLAAQVDRQRSQRGIVAARRVIALGNGLAESPMESRLRMRILNAGLPPPVLQWSVTDEFGYPAYRLDLAWPRQRVAVEYDGAGHMERARQRYDITRRTWLAHARWTVLWATDRDVYIDHRHFLRQLEEVLRSAPGNG